MENTEGQFCFTHLSGEDIYLFRLSNTKGTEVCITNYGAIITSFRVRQADGLLNNIVLGFDDVKNYFAKEYHSVYPYFGAVIGRYANRIKNGEFYIEDRQYLVAKNKGADHLHGGLEGFDKKVWKPGQYTSHSLALTYRSPDGEEGYPGNLDTEIRFELTDENELIYEIVARTDQPTAVNLTHHSYFNLDNGLGTIDMHQVMINAGEILEQDENFVATGDVIPVTNTRYDFTKSKRIDKDWIPADGFDQTFVLNTKNIDAVAAEAYSFLSGLRLQVFTTEPVIHFYTGKWIPKLNLESGKNYDAFSGFCLETQKHPNAINFVNGPNAILKPGETYYTKTRYRILASV
jgi:aldose 1-epimerase